MEGHVDMVQPYAFSKFIEQMHCLSTGKKIPSNLIILLALAETFIGL